MTDAAGLLEMRGISKRFGATRALRNVTLDVRRGEVLALIGENGAGKSTLMKVLSGAHTPDTGEMTLNGMPFAPRRPNEARRAGIAMIYQELTLAPDLTVAENVMLGQERHSSGVLRRGEERKLVSAALARLGHDGLDLDRPVRELPIGIRQVVEIARALVQDAQLIVFDEPTSSLTQHDVDRLFAVIRTLRSAGLGIVYISHFLEEIGAIADRYSVLRDGETVGFGSMQGVTESQLVSLMVGRSVD